MTQQPQPAPREVREPPAGQSPKLGEGLVRDVLARGATELANGLGLHGHDYGQTVHDYGHGR